MFRRCALLRGDRIEENPECSCALHGESQRFASAASPVVHKMQLLIKCFAMRADERHCFTGRLLGGLLWWMQPLKTQLTACLQKSVNVLWNRFLSTGERGAVNPHQDSHGGILGRGGRMRDHTATAVLFSRTVMEAFSLNMLAAKSYTSKPKMGSILIMKQLFQDQYH